MKKSCSDTGKEKDLFKDMSAQIITEQGSSSKNDLATVLFFVNNSRKEVTEEVVPF